MTNKIPPEPTKPGLPDDASLEEIVSSEASYQEQLCEHYANKADGHRMKAAELKGYLAAAK